MATKTRQRTETEFLCLTISANGGNPYTDERGLSRYAYRVYVASRCAPVLRGQPRPVSETDAAMIGRDDTRPQEAQPAVIAHGPSPRAAGTVTARGAQPPARHYCETCGAPCGPPTLGPRPVCSRCF